MLYYSDFYDIAKYANDNWKACFTQKEIACSAYEYMVEYEASFKIGRTPTISTLIENLNEDTRSAGCEEVVEDWLRDLMRTPMQNQIGKTEVLTEQIKHKSI